MSFDAYLSPTFNNHAISADRESRAFNTHEFAPIHVLFLPDPEGFADRPVLIHREWYGKCLLFYELFVGLKTVARDADDIETFHVESSFQRLEILGLVRASRRVILWIEEEDEAPASAGGNGNGAAGRLKLEAWSGIACRYY